MHLSACCIICIHDRSIDGIFRVKTLPITQTYDIVTVIGLRTQQKEKMKFAHTSLVVAFLSFLRII